MSTLSALSVAPGGHRGLAVPDPAIRVLICDGHDVFRAGVRTVVENAPGLEMVGAVADGTRAMAVARQLRPDIVVAAADLPGLGGPELVARFADDGLLASMNMIMLMFPEQSRVALAALRVGARGALTRSQHADALTEAIRAVSHGNVVLAPALADGLVAGPAFAPPTLLSPLALTSARVGDGSGFGDLSVRQFGVLSKICQGLSNTEIAKEFCLTEATVKTHVSSLLRRFGLRDRTQLVVYAYHHGFPGQVPDRSRAESPRPDPPRRRPTATSLVGRQQPGH